MGGHFEIMKWLQEMGCRWDETVCAGAAVGGHLELLKWLREQQCPWDSETCLSAIQGGHLEVLKWARENGCQWDAFLCDITAEKHPDIREWMKEQNAKKPYRKMNN